MKLKAVLYLAVLGCMVIPAFAAPCVMAPLSAYATSDFNCTFSIPGTTEVLTIKEVNFSRLDVGPLEGGIPTDLASASEITVVPPATVGDALGFFSDQFSVGSMQHARYIFSYIIDPPPPVIPGFDLELFAESPVFPGKAIITTDLCPAGTFGGTLGCIGFDGSFFAPFTLTVFHNGGPTCDKCFDTILFPESVNFVSVRNTIDLIGGNGGSSQITGISNQVAAVPEPANMLIVGLGLMALRFLRRRP